MESAREIPLLGFRAGQIEQTPTPILPEEVVAEIFSWLPVKSLLRFRCVSKFWRCLIDSKHFVKSHLEKSRKHPSFAHHSIIAQSCDSSDHPNLITGLGHFSLPSVLNNRPTYMSTYDDPLSALNDKLLVGTCDGLVCILSYSSKNVFLWNPSTRIFIQLPSMDDELYRWSIFDYGFGLDESNGDYKVFCLLRSLEEGFGDVGKVYSLKTNSWRTTEFMNTILHSSVGQFVSGKLHWLGKSYNDPTRVGIVYFDLEKEVYGMMELPSHIDAYCDLQEVVLTLGIVEECLCVIFGHLGSSPDIWVMKQYGVNKSWTKLMTFPYVCDSWEHSFLKPLFLGQNGEILLFARPIILVYSPRDKRVWNPVMHSLNEFEIFHVYIESLVSPVLVVNSE